MSVNRLLRADPESERAILRAIDEAADAIMIGDVDTCLSYMEVTPDSVMIGTGPEEIVHGRGQLHAALLRQVTAVGSTVTTIKWRRVWKEGPVAWATGEAEIAVLSGEHVTVDYRFTYVLVQRDEEWRIVHFHFSVGDRAQPAGEVWPLTMEAVAAAVQLERPDLRAQVAPDGMVTLLFTDIENSTPLNDRLGDIRWTSVLREHNEIVRESIAAHGGFEVKTIGDAFMVAFQSARRAVLCALYLQRACAAYSSDHPDEPVRLRIGLHAGEPVREAGDFYGKSVTFASRVADQAKGGEILVSSLVRELVEAAGDITFAEARDATLKGIPGTHTLHLVLAV